jgi:hypothetical protein
MRNIVSKIAIAAVIGFAGMPAANAATTDGTAGAKIIAPLQIAAKADLYFGTIAPSLTAGDTVLVTVDGDKKCGAALTCLTADHTAAAFAVSGEADAVYTISLPDAIEITNGNGDGMKVYAFTGSKDSGVLVKGNDSFTVGGELAVAAMQPAGKYRGNFVVAVEYQ